MSASGATMNPILKNSQSWTASGAVAVMSVVNESPFAKSNEWASVVMMIENRHSEVIAQSCLPGFVIQYFSHGTSSYK